MNYNIDYFKINKLLENITYKILDSFLIIVKKLIQNIYYNVILLR